MKLSKLFGDLFYMAAVIVAGYVLYKIWQAVSGAAGAVANTANQWTPGGLFQSTENSISQDLQDFYDTLVGAEKPDPSISPFLTPSQADPSNFYYDSFVNNSLTNSIDQPFSNSNTIGLPSAFGAL